LAGIPAAALLLWHSAYWHAGADLSSLPAPRRYWEDLAVAASRVVGGGEPRAEPVSINSADGAELRLGFQRSLTRAAAEEGIRPWQFWRTLAVRPLLKGRLLLPREIDDPGRAGLLTAGFRLLGGIAPFLPLWLGALAAAPVVAWAGWELSRAGRTAAGVVFTLLLACSPYVIDALALPYSAVGFYLIALVAIVPLAAHAVLAEVRPAGLVVRAVSAGVVFALCVLCRSGSIFLLSGYALTLAAGAWRIGPGASPPRPARRVAYAAALLALFLVPYALVYQPRHHEVWLGLWEGLGDFDRTKGHAWDDDVAREVLRRAGAALPERYPVWENAPENEAFFRRLVLANVRSAPGWYAGILGRRLWTTLMQSKLSPWGPRDGVSMAPRESPSEGAIDTYYSMATPMDWLGVGPWRFEVPLVLLWGPTLLLILLFGLGPWVASLRPASARLGPALFVVLCTAVAGLGLPVLFTTAAGLETQAFAIVYFLGFAFLVDEAVRYARTRAAGLPAG
jgi:hypothetical protein